MSKETESFFKAFSQYTGDHGFESEEDLKAALQAFVAQYNQQIMQGNRSGDPETADDFLALAEGAFTKKEALKYAKEALKLEPDNIDAQTAVAVYSSATPETTLDKLKSVYTSATAQMKKQGWFDEENIGKFWLITETRPYMRLLDTYAGTLYDCGMMKLAAEILREMIRLCENDNLGARYTLMHIYSFLEEEDAARELEQKYSDDNSAEMLLPLSILYYRLNDMKRSASYLRKIKSSNQDAVNFFKGLHEDNLEDYVDVENMNPLGYRPYTMDELLVEFEEHKTVLLSVPNYLDWAYKKIKGTSKKK